MTGICKHCGKVFTRGNNQVKYCSDECRKEYHKVHKRKKPQMESVCPECGITFIKRHANQIYCSEHCNIEHKRKAHRKPPEKKNCGICGKEFYGRRADVYCSDECRAKASSLYMERYYSRHREPKMYHLQCNWCGKEYESRYKSHKFCSEECEKLFNEANFTMVCKSCGKSFYSRELKILCDDCEALANDYSHSRKDPKYRIGRNKYKEAAEDSDKALASGLSYGQYMALRGIK